MCVVSWLFHKNNCYDDHEDNDDKDDEDDYQSHEIFSEGFNPFTPKSDQFQISPSASPEM